MFTAGVSRVCITPYWGVELTGWGYYIGRTWRRIHDHLNATALVLDDGSRQAVLICLDLMIIDEPFARRARELIQRETGIPPHAVLLTCSHSHNAPAAGGLLGVGECDPLYEDWASRQAATAAIIAWRNRTEARVGAAHRDLNGITFNRTRPGGVVDPRVTTLRIDEVDGNPLALVVNFGAHPTVSAELRPFDVSRDVPGEVCELIEAALPGVTAMYVQGACGDVNFLREYATAERCHEPAWLVAQAALDAQSRTCAMIDPTVSAAAETISLPTRRWTREEIERDRSEAARRLAANDTSGWRESIGRSMTNRPDDMVARHGGDELKAVRAMCRFHLEWTDRMLADYETRPEQLETEVQALRIGDLSIVANASEFFTPLALDVRNRADGRELMFACYANGRIGYLPDAYDIEARSYAGYQSPKYCNQFPFTPESGPAMCDGMLRVLSAASGAGRVQPISSRIGSP